MRSFYDEIESVHNTRSVENSSSLLKLKPFLDDKCLLRIGGRLKNSQYSNEIIHPILLPKEDHVTCLLAEHFHQLIDHQGRTTTVNKIRSEGYHIINETSMISSPIHRCVTSKKLRGNLSNQQIADALTNVGYDYFGPFTIEERRKTLKKYGLLFTCYTY